MRRIPFGLKALVGHTCMVLALMPAPAFAASGCKVTGLYAVRSSQWYSFRHWVLAFVDDVLVDSYTDDLSAAEWPTEMVKGDDRFLIDANDFGAGAILRYTLVLNSYCSDGQGELELMQASQTFLDTASPEGTAFTLLTDATLRKINQPRSGVKRGGREE